MIALAKTQAVARPHNLGFDFEVTSSGTFDKLGGESAEEAPESVPGEDCFEDSPVK